MISQVNSAAVRAAYARGVTEKEAPKPNATVSKKEDGSTKIEKLRASIDAGEYKVDLSALANKMADELL